NALAAKRVEEADVAAKIEPWPEWGSVYKTVRAHRRRRRIVKARSAPHDGLGVQLIGEPQTRREIAEIAVRTERRRTTWIVVGPAKQHAHRSIRKSLGLRARMVADHSPFLLRVGPIGVPPQAQIQGKLRVDPPVVLT